MYNGKMWILLGEKLLHIPSPSVRQSPDETYKFFMKNVDLDGRLADLGDYMSLEKSLNDDDITESIAIMVALAGQFIYDLEQKQFIPSSPDLRHRFLRALAEGFTGLNLDAWQIPDVLLLKDLEYQSIQFDNFLIETCKPRPSGRGQPREIGLGDFKGIRPLEWV